MVSDSITPNDEGESKGSTSRSYTEVFYQHLPYYLAIGMPCDEYWNGDCCLVKGYREADKIRQRRNNQNLWLQGMYVYEAFLDVAPVLHAFNKKPKPLPYPSEPYPLTDEEREEKRIRDEQRWYAQMKARMVAWTNKTNTQFQMRTLTEVSDNE